MSATTKLWLHALVNGFRLSAVKTCSRPFTKDLETIVVEAAAKIRNHSGVRNFTPDPTNNFWEGQLRKATKKDIEQLVKIISDSSSKVQLLYVAGGLEIDLYDWVLGMAKN